MVQGGYDMDWYSLDAEHVDSLPITVETMTDLMTQDALLEFIGKVARVCYNSSDEPGACRRRALNAITSGHHSPWEHYNITILSCVDRGTTHALVRHRHCAFQQGSTIYQKYNENIKVISLPTVDPATGKSTPEYTKDVPLLLDAVYIMYKRQLNNNIPTHQARDLLPTDLASNLIITTNFRQWMYIMQRRVGPGDTVRMHTWAYMIRKLFEEHYPDILAAFDDWYKKHPL